MFDHNKIPKVASFGELTKQVHLINDLILADMTCEDVDNSKEAVRFSKHLLATKYWFARISYSNKKRYLLALLHDMRSAWALSLLLKSMWNCRPKDAVLSTSERNVYTSYDQVPMDHNRTALPGPTLAQVMKNDRIWFLSLDPESQALVLSELMTVAGGPAMWEVLKLARTLFERNRELMLKNIQECIVVNDQNQKSKHDSTQTHDSVESPVTAPTPGEADKVLNANLATWNATIKSMRDSLKLEEIEMIFNDGSKRKIWKVNRVKPEVTETVDFIQMLPSSIGKKVLSFLPRAQLGDYAKVNKYWAYLVEELKAELATRAKINTDFDKFHELLLRHDTSLEFYASHDDQAAPPSSQGWSLAPSKGRQPLPSMRASERSAGAYSLRYFLPSKLVRPIIVQKPIRNMADLSERLERRGATDENIWKWCNCILAHAKKIKQIRERMEDEDGVLCLGNNVHFPCPLMKVSMEIPLIPPLYQDPIISTSAKPRRNLSECAFVHVPKEITKRFSLWTRDLSTLYRVFKIPSYLNPELPTVTLPPKFRDT
ncbi:uncharacterized protein LOC111359695 [Spodoptera litura]|uniref:Uncharacterized protein LOC111359695 n=1 Tax=Spodoptera litura TaxID=69820 RepID=A0A9J7J1I6_SPOLT|nr:uncharacterized protein LOC111359695 [Spodoptera litura]